MLVFGLFRFIYVILCDAICGFTFTRVLGTSIEVAHVVYVLFSAFFCMYLGVDYAN